MVVSVSGAFYVFETETDPTREDLAEFFKDLTENDILEVRVKKSMGREIVYHVTRFFLDNDLRFMNLALEKSDQVFQQVSRMNLHNCILPVFENGTCVNFVKNVQTRYDHYYRYEGEIDTGFLNQYKRLVLTGLNEYSVELYKKALPLWTGDEVLLVGPEWRDYLDVLPEPERVRVTVSDEMPESGWAQGACVQLTPESSRVLAAKGHSGPGNSGISGENTLYIIEGNPDNESISRDGKDIISYDDIMTLTFMFSYVISPGCLNPDKKFFVIDGAFLEEGFFRIWDNVFAAARYAKAKGYHPVFQIVSSDRNKYSDVPGEDIWNKFFLQPEGYTMKEVHNSSYLALSPDMRPSPEVRCFMDKVSGGIELSWPRGIFNNKVKKYIKERGEGLLTHPERALGVLAGRADSLWGRGPESAEVRGALGYLAVPGGFGAPGYFGSPDYSGHGPAQMAADKVREIEDATNFDYIYLLTDDEDARSCMREQFGSRVIFAEPEPVSCRSEAEPELTVAELYEKRDEGFRLGAEYLRSVSLLSCCKSVVVWEIREG